MKVSARVPVFFLCLFFYRPFHLPAQSGSDLSVTTVRGVSWAYRDLLPGPHQGAVRALLSVPAGEQSPEDQCILSAGDDGFIERWDLRGAKGPAKVPTEPALFPTDRFQISPYAISAMVKHPEKSELCAVENGGLGRYRISVWNYPEKERRFTLSFPDPLRYVTYSASGSFIIVSGMNGLVFIDSVTGETLPGDPFTGLGSISLAVTGRSERSMLVYLQAGFISYWNLESGDEASRRNAPANLSSPVLFGSNRYLAGIDAGGLVILDAVSAEIVIRNPAVPRTAFLSAENDSTELACLIPGTGKAPEYFKWEIDQDENLAVREHFFLPSHPEITSFLVSQDGRGIYGTASGEAGIVNAARAAKPRFDASAQAGTPGFSPDDQDRIVEAAVSGGSIAFFTENKRLGFLPLNYSRVNGSVPLAATSGYTRISGTGGDQFLFWDTERGGRLPLVVQAGGDLSGERGDFIEKPGTRPLLSASVRDGKVLMLDSSGNVLIYGAGKRIFTHVSRDAMDAAFIDDENIILARSAVSGNAAFLKINTVNGETVPIDIPASAGVRVYSGASGKVYGAVIRENTRGAYNSHGGTGLKTAIFALDTAKPSLSRMLAEYSGEDTYFAIAESGGIAAAILEGDRAAAFPEDKKSFHFERSPGLPLRLLDGGSFFISLDSEGAICWHEQKTGKLLAVFRLYGDAWMMHTEREARTGSTR
jgi:hypothetical protein